MKHFVLAASISLVSFGFITACGSNSEVPEEETNSTSLPGQLGKIAKGLEEAAKAMEEMQNVTVEPVDFRTLRDLLPGSAAGLERKEADGEKSGASGMSISKAEGTYYADDNDRRITITISDMGSMTSLVAFSMAWINLDIDKETSNGFERTTKIDGFASLEKHEQNGDYSSSEIQTMVANRYLVSVDGRNVPFDDVKKALRSVDLKKLDRMKSEGVTPNS